jgi:hypothetical protein
MSHLNMLRAPGCCLLCAASLVASLLLLLPPSIHTLEIAGPCSSPAIADLQCLPRLRSLRITDNADAVDWRMCLRRYPRALLALEHLSGLGVFW